MGIVIMWGLFRVDFSKWFSCLGFFLFFILLLFIIGMFFLLESFFSSVGGVK